VRACYAALAMQAAVGQYAEGVRRQQGLDVQMRVGLNSGEVVVRSIGNDLHMDYSAVGQTTHLAARMEQLARPGTTLLTADTLRLVEGLVQVKALGPVPVKGLPEPVEVFELVGVSTLRGRFQARVARGLTRFVGRQHELDTLHQALRQVQREMKLALDAWQELPEGTIHTIPVRIDDCEVPESFRRYHWANLFKPNGFDRIIRAIRSELAKPPGTASPSRLQEGRS
jgi:Adenylate and Guanylate cyclase catalytic domain